MIILEPLLTEQKKQQLIYKNILILFGCLILFYLKLNPIKHYVNFYLFIEII